MSPSLGALVDTCLLSHFAFTMFPSFDAGPFALGASVSFASCLHFCLWGKTDLHLVSFQTYYITPAARLFLVFVHVVRYFLVRIPIFFLLSGTWNLAILWFLFTSGLNTFSSPTANAMAS